MHGRNHRNFGLSIVFLEQQPICLLRNSRDKHDVSYNIERRSLFSTCITRRTSERLSVVAAGSRGNAETHRRSKKFLKKSTRRKKKKGCCVDFGNVALSILDARPFSPYIDERPRAYIHACVHATYVSRCSRCKRVNRIVCICLYAPQYARLRVAFPYVINDRFSQTHRVSSSLLVHEPKGISALGEISTVHVRVIFPIRARAVNGFKIVPCRLYKRTQLRFLGNHFQIQTSSNRCRFVNRDRSNESNLSS